MTRPPNETPSPPFSEDVALRQPDSHNLPATIRANDARLLDPSEHLENHYMEQELMTRKLDEVYRHLWLAGLPRPARQLHRQRLIGRSIIITEDPNEHLVWHDLRIFVKPLPEIILSYECWTKYICQSPQLRKAAHGFLLSYVWLIGYPSDFSIAKETGLIPVDVTYDGWTAFAKTVLSNTNLTTMAQVSRRYHYGELRLSRLDLMYRLSSKIVLRDPSQVWRGYVRFPATNKSFFERNFGWLLVVFAYVSVTLSAMQVSQSTGLGWASEDMRLMRVCAGYSVAILILVVTVALVAAFSWLVLAIRNVAWTRRFNDKVERARVDASTKEKEKEKGSSDGEKEASSDDTRKPELELNGDNATMC